MENHSNSVNLLKSYRVKHRQFSALPYYDPRYAHHFPFFGYGTIEMMLRDSRVRFGLLFIKGPIIAYTKFFSEEESEDPQVNQAMLDLEYMYPYKVTCSSKDTEAFIIKTLNKFWEDGLNKALRSLEYGYSPNQVLYERGPDGKIQYKTMHYYSPMIGRPVTRKHALLGIHLKTTDTFIPLPKSCVFVHQREFNSTTGQSRLFGAHIPWHETWNIGGARDIRRIWFFKNAYDSGTLYFPEGSTTDEETGEVINNLEIATEIMDSTQTGSYRVLPKPANSNGGKNDKTWDYESPTSNRTPDGLLDYVHDLRCEILEGMGIPREVVESEGSQGFGSSSGRKIPMVSFIASLMPIVTEVIQDFRSQILDPLLRVNQLSTDYEIARILPKSMEHQLPEDGSEPNDNLKAKHDK